MTQSMLIYREVPEYRAGGAGTLLGLHGRGGTLDQLLPLSQEAAPSFRVVMPQAARPITPTSHGYVLEEDGFSWYLGQDFDRPEPATFGESLWQVEQFLYDLEDQQSRKQPIFLVGYGQGAVLTLSMAGVAPESLAGVAGICGCLPEIRGWSPPMATLDGLPVLLVYDPDDIDVPSRSVRKTAEQLVERKAMLDLRSVPGARQDPRRAAGALRDWIGIHMAEISSESHALGLAFS